MGHREICAPFLCFRKKKCPLDDRDLRLRLVEVDGDDVEAGGSVFREMAEVVAGDATEIVALVGVNSGLGGGDVAGGASFNLDKTEFAFVPSDKIEFALMPRGAEVAGDDDVFVFAEVEVGEFFAAASGAQVLGLGGYREDGVEDADGELSEEAHGFRVARFGVGRCDG